MRVAVVYNLARTVVAGRPEDIVADKDMEIVPQLVCEELKHLGHSVSLVEADWHLLERCASLNPDIALNLTEGFAGTNAHEHLAPCLLEFAGIPYTGGDATSMLTLRDKLYTKQILANYAVPMAPHYLAVDSRSAIVEQMNGLQFPVILKPVREEASMGIYYSSVVTTWEQLAERLDFLFEVFRQPILVEHFVIGREVSVGVWGNRKPTVLPACEFRFRGDNPLKWFRSFEYKWEEGKEIMEPLRDMPDSVASKLTEYALTAHSALRCRDYSRSDFRVSPDGTIYFLEHNFNPGIGPNTHGLNNTFPMMAEFAGVGYAEFLTKIIEFALERYPARGHGH